jgi:hypothetical protein
MRANTLIAIGMLSGCSGGPSAQIVVPLPGTTVVATVELRMTGHELSATTATKVYVDLVQVTGELIDNTLPEACDDDCNFVISFAGASITNGPHNLGVTFFDGETQLASDAVSLIFAR